MIIRKADGNLIVIKRSDYLNDNEYYKEIRKIISLYKDKYSSFINPKELK
jgi:hypothetical protein